MSNSKNYFIKGLLTFMLVIVVLVLVLFGAMMVYRSNMVSLTNQIEAQQTANKSNYDAMWKKFKEMTQVTEIQAKDFKDVYTGLITGRYDDEGVLFKMVQESNPNLNQQVYSDLQREISSSRDTFDNNQKRLIDIVREYNTEVESNGGVLFNVILGYERMDPNSLIVTSDQTTDAFETNKADSINLKGD